MAFAHLPCYDIMEKVGQEVEAIRTHKAQVEQLRKDTLKYHYGRLLDYYFRSCWRVPYINSLQDNYKQVVAQIGRNSHYATKGLGSELSLDDAWAFRNIIDRPQKAEVEAEHNTRTYKMPNGVNIYCPDGKCLDRWGRPFVPIA